MRQLQEQQAVQFQQQQNWQGLANLAAQAVSANQKDGEAWYDTGLADDGLKRPADAIKAYQKALPLVVTYLRGSVVQLLAQDYVATNQPRQLVALYQQLTGSDPDIARALQTQYTAVLAQAAATPAASLPDISPSSLATLLNSLQGTWQKDAIPVEIQLNDEGGAIGFQATYYFYSPSTKTGMMVVVGAGGQTRLPAQSPNWSTIPLPQNFKSLAAATTGVPAQNIDHALLFWQTGNTADPTDFSWSIALTTPNAAPENIPAMIMSQADLSQLETQANSGNAAAQYALARVLAVGLAGPADTAGAVKWLNQSAALGNMQAENKLGQYYQYGIGVTRNPQTAASWYNKAANAGNPIAEYNLALLYETGLGVPQNWDTAVNLLSAAAKGGAPDALQEEAAILPADRAAHQAQLAQQQQSSSGTGGFNGTRAMLQQAASPAAQDAAMNPP
jgi:TPR repeat protein